MIAGIYLICFLVSVFVSLNLTCWVRDYSNRHGWVSKPELDRHVHTDSVPRLGGVAIFTSFALVAALAFLFGRPAGLYVSLPVHTLVSIFVSALIIFLLGLYDDIKGLGPYLKFSVQAVAAIVLYLGGLGVQRLDLFSAGQSLRTIVGLPLTVIWILLITNAFNLIDGLDGLAAGSAFFSTLVLFVTSLFMPNGTVALLSIALSGVILGFLRYNFHPASIFLGDSGSMLIGFLLAAFALAGSQKAPTMIAVAIPVLSFGFPILDVTLAVSRRFLSGKPLFLGDRDHIHHKLLKLGLSQRGAVLVLYAVTAAFALLSLVILHDAAMIALVLTVIGLGVALGVQYLGYAEFSEMHSILRRAAIRKRSVADNVAIRHAIEALNSCTDPTLFCKILKDSLQSVGFDGFRLGNSLKDGFSEVADYALELTDDGEIQLLWDSEGKRDSSWELRFELNAENQRRIGYFSLLRVRTESPLLVDLNLLSRDFRNALSQALLRTSGQMRARTRKSALEKVHAKAASSASD